MWVGVMRAGKAICTPRGTNMWIELQASKTRQHTITGSIQTHLLAASSSVAWASSAAMRGPSCCICASAAVSLACTAWCSSRVTLPYLQGWSGRATRFVPGVLHTELKVWLLTSVTGSTALQLQGMVASLYRFAQRATTERGNHQP